MRGFVSLRGDGKHDTGRRERWRAAAISGLFVLISLATLHAEESTVIVGATLIDGTGGKPVPDSVIVIEGTKIKAVGPRSEVQVPADAREIDGSGKYVIPGLMDANIHLFRDVSVEFIARYEGRFDDLIEEAAQIALKQGLTTVFDTWSPLQPLMDVRDRINRGETVGSRMFVAGNIVGFSGPFGREFNAVASWSAASDFVKRINWMFTENMGPELSWMTPEQVGAETRKYIARGIDFLKYAVSAHDCWGCSGFPRALELSALLMFTAEAQQAMIDECRRAGITVQTHTSSVESLRQAVELGVDMMQHGNYTGPTAIPDSTIELMLEKKIYCAVQPRTRKRMEREIEESEILQRPKKFVSIKHENIVRLIQSGVPLLLATDAGVSNPIKTEVESGKDELKEDHPEGLGEAHFVWFKAMAEKGMTPMDAIVAATRNNAAAYDKLDELGTLEQGKLADLLVLDADPLEDTNNIRKINLVMKDGRVVDRESLPIKKVLTALR